MLLALTSLVSLISITSAQNNGGGYLQPPFGGGGPNNGGGYMQPYPPNGGGGKKTAKCPKPPCEKGIMNLGLMLKGMAAVLLLIALAVCFGFRLSQCPDPPPACSNPC